MILRGGVYYRVNPVTAAAGDRVRASLSGFFYRREGLASLIGLPGAARRIDVAQET